MQITDELDPEDWYVEKFELEVCIVLGRWVGFNFRGWRLSWPEFRGNRIKRAGFINLGPISFWYTNGDRAYRL